MDALDRNFHLSGSFWTCYIDSFFGLIGLALDLPQSTCRPRKGSLMTGRRHDLCMAGSSE